MKQLILALTVLLGITSLLTTQALAQAAFYNVTDGSLNDWGVIPGYDWDPNPGIVSTLEDYKVELDLDKDGYLGPGWGGQPFDAEAMYITADSNYLYYAIVTGMPTSGFYDTDSKELLLPGDIAINFNNEGFKYGIAVPNYHPGAAGTNGALYNVDSTRNTDTASGWEWSTWWSDANDIVPFKIQQYGGMITDVTPGAQYIASGEFQYTNFILSPSFTGTGEEDKTHWIIEGYVPISGFSTDWGKSFEMVWTQTCGNDIIRGQYNVIPEPSTLILLSLGMAGIIGRKLKTKK